MTNKQYYIRAGSDFVPTPHDVLAGMFGRRPQPHVFPHYLLSAPTLENGRLKISFGSALHNEGPGIASDIFSICRIDSVPGQNCHVSVDTPDRTNWTGSWEFDRQLSLISAAGYRMPPGSNAQPMVVSLVLEPPFDSDLRLFVRVGAGESRRYEAFIGAPADTVIQQYQLFLDKSAAGDFSRPEKLQIAEALLKQNEA